MTCSWDRSFIWSPYPLWTAEHSQSVNMMDHNFELRLAPCNIQLTCFFLGLPQIIKVKEIPDEGDTHQCHQNTVIIHTQLDSSFERNCEHASHDDKSSNNHHDDGDNIQSGTISRCLSRSCRDDKRSRRHVDDNPRYRSRITNSNSQLVSITMWGR